MKKYILLFFLIAGLSGVSIGQKTTFYQNGFERATKKKHQRKHQVTHFEKRMQDKKLGNNGTSYKNAKRHNVDAKSFASVNRVRDDKKFVRNSRAMKKQYKNQLKESVYASNNSGGSLRRQLLRGR